jgi:hypothetical protein
MLLHHALLLLTLCIAGCTGKTTDSPGGTDSATEGCRENTDCQTTASPEAFCVDGDDVLCGTCQDPERACESREDCGEGMVCQPITLTCPCSSSADTSTECVPECTADSCGTDSACNETTGLCEVIHCADGATCPDHHTCDTDAEGTGCVRDVCAGDGDCGDGYCVRGACFETLGYCTDEVP